MISWKSIKVLDDLHNMFQFNLVYMDIMEIVFVVCGGRSSNIGEIVSRWINVNIYIYMYLFFFQNERNVSNILIVIVFPRTPSITFGPPRFASLHPSSSNLCFLIDEYVIDVSSWNGRPCRTSIS